MTKLPSAYDEDTPIDYDALVGAFNQALLHTLRKHSVADSFLDFWVPDADPLLGIMSMIDSARIAGRKRIVIQVRRGTVPEARVEEIEEAARHIAKVVVDRQSDHVVLRLTDLLPPNAESMVQAERRDEAARYWNVQDLAPGSSHSDPTVWDSTELPEFSDAHPALRPGLKVAGKSLQREGTPTVALNGCLRVTGHSGKRSLVLDVDMDTHVVKSAWHSGCITPSERIALDAFCRRAEGTPIQEVADHVGLYVIDAMIDNDKAPPVAGILLPVNAGAPFQLAAAMARQAYDSYRATTGLAKAGNFFVSPPSDAWLALSSEDRRSRIESGLRAFLQSEQLFPDDLTLLRVDRTKTGLDTRAVVAFSDRIEVSAKPPLLRRLETRLRRDVERQLELVADRARDKSPLRRLS